MNYFDYKFQDAKGKVELLDKWNIPVWVMEPVRGGQLAKLSDDATLKLKAARPDEDVPAWAFRFLQSFPSVKELCQACQTWISWRQTLKLMKITGL
ncbi:MAG: hypothetical protein MR424_11815 [Treponema sp.]|nr:hypothetical protein [Treponema sp.]